MSKLKRTLSFLTVSLIAALFFASAGPIEHVASADILEDLSDLFTTGDQSLSFTEFTPGEDLTLSEDGLNESLTTTSSFREFVVRIINFALGFLGLFAVIIIIYAGILYVSAAGEDEQTGKAKKAILYATVGLLIVMGSFAFVNTVISGAGGGEEDDFIVGGNLGTSFNASASQVRSSAQEVYTGFAFYAEAAEEVKAMYNDANKASLDYTKAVVSQQNILNYLFSVHQKLLNLRSRVIRFSSSYVKINELINYLDRSIDEVKNLKVGAWFRLIPIQGNLVFDVSTVGGALTVCTSAICTVAPNNSTAFTDGVFYPENLYETWTEIRSNLIDKNSDNPQSLAYILEPIKENYIEQVNNQISDLVETRQSLTGIQAVEAGDIGTIFNDTMKCYDSETFPQGNECATGFLQELRSWNVDSDATKIDRAGGILFKALEKQLEFAKAVAALESVEAHLRANVISGNAPLVVTFDVLDTVDPAGGTIISDNIRWNLDGQLTFEGDSIQNQNLQNFSLTPDIVVCEQPTNDNEDVFGTVFRQCVFKRPGTYVATVTVNSNDPTQFVSGMSSLIIKVNPPTTRVNLDLTLPDQQEITVMSYYEDVGLLKVDRDYVPLTLEEASEITFDASATENVKNFKWDFGDGQNVDSDVNGIQVHSYDSEGKYTVELEVLNELGEVDRKIFTIDVRNVAARISMSPSEDVFINTPVLLDGALSSVSSGSIRSYEWRVTKLSGEQEEIDLGANVGKASFTHEFEEPGKYQIDLKVTSSLESVSAEPVTIDVKSQPPVAIFDASIPKANQPNTFSFNADKSFDADGDENNLEYEWSITPPSNGGENWEWVGGSSIAEVINEQSPLIKFRKKGNYEVSLKVTDSSTIGVGLNEESGTTTEDITVDNILDIDWAADQESTVLLDDTGKGTMNFKIISDNAIAYEIDFGDGDTSIGEIDGAESIPHTYTQSGRYLVEVRVFDEDDNDDSITRSVFVGGGDSPVAKASVFVNGQEVTDLMDVIEVNKTDILTFDAVGSKNVDGTGRNLRYSWNFGDTARSSERSATHSYDELSPDDPGYFTVTLTVFDVDAPDEPGMDEIRVRVINKEPKFSSLQAIPDVSSSNLVTPVDINLRAFGVDDEDGTVTQYKWWYYDVRNPDEPLGIQVTQTPNTKISIGTNGRQGQQITYGFGLEITDNDNLKVSSTQLFPREQIPTVTVTNGTNELPVAKFNVDATTIFTGDQITFTSASTDADGRILTYIWDVEGDGFFNNLPTNRPSIQHEYNAKNLNGYNVRLKVRDDKGGEAVSAPIKIFVDTLAKPPTAAFQYKVIQGSSGKKISFINNSTVDTAAGAEILRYEWDFDTDSTLRTADSNGDGVKDNDVDSKAKSPERLYVSNGVYNVRLTITDNQGNTDSVSRTISIPLASPPVASFSYQVGSNGSIQFFNNSKVDAVSTAQVVQSSWDFDTNTDSDGNGTKDDDLDSSVISPIHKYSRAGSYQVKLTVTDSQGGIGEITNQVNATVGSGTTPESPQAPLVAILKTQPSPNSDAAVYLDGESGTVLFDFKNSVGSIASYSFDKNIYFDTDGNGIKTDDEDFKTILPGTWTTNFEKAWGKTVVKLTITDIYGNTHSTTQEIKFE